MRRLAILLLLFSCKSPGNSSISFNEDFESEGYRDKWDWIDTCCSHSLQRTNSLARTGNWSLQVSLDKPDTAENGMSMAELEANLSEMDTTQHWWAFSNFLPVDFVADSSYDVLAGWLPHTDACETSLVAPVLFNIEKDRWNVTIGWNTKGICSPESAPGDFSFKTFDLGPCERQRWNDWIFHIHFSYGTDGLVQVWKNGQLLLDYKGPCFYKDAEFASFKIGIMKQAWNLHKPASGEVSVVSHRQYFLDHIRIGNANAGLRDFNINSKASPK